jgi:hypothetical protein
MTIQFWCLVRDGAVVGAPRRLPEAWEDVSNFHALPETDILARGWRRHRVVAARPDTILTGLVREITDHEVVDTQTWRDPTPEELAERARADVPVEVALWRLRAAVALAGSSEQVEAAIHALPDPPRTVARIAWEYGNTVERHHPLVTLIATACALDEPGLDDLFRDAAAIGA